MTCPLCSGRKARRSCPALGQVICAVCCGTKRLVEIRCPADCGYLAAARDHPPAATVRQQERDLSLLVHFTRDLNERQSQLLLALTTFLAGYRPDDLQTLIDDDVAEAAGALAATFETASRGVIYDHRPASLPAGRLASRLRTVILEIAPKHGSTPFERDAAGVLRRIEGTVRELGSLARESDTGSPASPGNPGNTDPARPFLALLERVTRDRSLQSGSPSGEGDQDTPRLIVP